jgi:hypothetical protein
VSTARKGTEKYIPCQNSFQPSGSGVKIKLLPNIHSAPARVVVIKVAMNRILCIK